jgi:hypothetical protein
LGADADAGAEAAGEVAVAVSAALGSTTWLGGASGGGVLCIGLKVCTSVARCAAAELDGMNSGPF